MHASFGFGFNFVFVLLLHSRLLAPSSLKMSLSQSRTWRYRLADKSVSLEFALLQRLPLQCNSLLELFIASFLLHCIRKPR